MALIRFNDLFYINEGKCQCRPQWTGPRCGELVLKPANRQSGYHYQENGVNISSWGGAVLHVGLCLLHALSA